MPALETAVQDYFETLRRVHGTGAGTSELSHYAALEGLLNALGGDLRPKVFCVSQLADQGAGHPDFGLYAAGQCQRGRPRDGQLPERGVIEVKSPADDAWLTAGTGQISRYWDRYRLVLVTNYRDFLLIGEDAAGRPANLEAFRLANSDAEFWSRILTPRKYAQEVARSLGEYLRRVLTRTVALTEPRDVAWFLASYGRDALGRVTDKGDVAALAALGQALEEALGVRFEGDKGDHFFHSTLVQTLFYGVFSAWVLWARAAPPAAAPFDWRTANWYLRVPMIQALFQQVADPARLQALDLVEVLDWAAAALNRVDRGAFFARFDDTEAVQHFYEPFLEAFDPELRKQLGVWYTPPEVVRYMVARVDRALRDDLGVADGLAGDNVYILDPCTGTGSFLAEVLRRIAANLDDAGLGAAQGAAVRQAATTRVFGFEIMPAPFVVAHLQVGLVLHQLGAPLPEDGGERAAIYLTNALTGWEPTDREKQLVGFPEMAEERDRANRVKRERPILVILGNPPYNGYAGMAMAEERSLSDAYRTTRGGLRRPEGQGLNDLYVRFFRMAERRIAEQTGRGVICFISNYSWLDGLSFSGMRQRYLDAFDAIRIDCLNGDKYKTGKVAPDGTPDPSIFSTEHNREGIQVGTAIATLIREADRAGSRAIQFRHLWGRDKRRQLLDTATTTPAALYDDISPVFGLGLPFRDTEIASDYFDWPTLPELLPSSFPGVKTSRDTFLVDIDLERLRIRVAEYFDQRNLDEEIARKYPSVMKSGARFDAAKTRDFLKRRGIIDQSFVRYAYRPFDIRWLYWETKTKLLDEKRAAYQPHVFERNIWVEAREKQTKEKFSRGAITTRLADNYGNGLSHFFPAYLRDDHDRDGDADAPVRRRANLTGSGARALAALDLGVEDLFHHIVSVLHSPAYRRENAGALRMDWPRIPVPDSRETLGASAALGRELAALLDPETPAAGVTTGGLRAEMKVLGVPAKRGGGDWAGADFAVTAGWGGVQANGAVMPGTGKVETRDYRPDEVLALAAGAGRLGLTAAQGHDLLGETTNDAYLNADAYWANVPAKVWDYKLGGYQVIKKWLSYREQAVLDRPLGLDEVRAVTDMIRRIAAILLRAPALDANYEAVRAGARASPAIQTQRAG